MKKFLLLVLVIITVFCSCGTKNTEVPKDKSYNFETDAQYYYRKYCDVIPVTASPDGYYYVGTHGIVIYIDKKTMSATPLCNKANCLHNDEEVCSAYLVSWENADDGDESATTVIQYNEGYLYALGNEYNSEKQVTQSYLKRFDLDGTNTVKLSNNFDVEVWEWIIHRGYFYYATEKHLYRLPLNSMKSEPEILFTAEKGQKESNNISELTAYDNYLYFDGAEHNKKEKTFSTFLYCLNLETLEYENVTYNGEKVSLTTFLDGKVMFQDGNSAMNEVYFYLSDFYFENAELFTTKTFSWHISTDGKYIYYDNSMVAEIGDYDEQKVIVYDLQMNEVDSFKMPRCTAAGQDSDYFLIPVEEDGETFLYAIDKSNIGKFKGETAEMKKLCTLDWFRRENPDYLVVG